MKTYFTTKKRDLFGYGLIVPLMAASSAFFAKALEPLLNVAYAPDMGDFIRCACLFVGIGVLDMVFYYLHRIFRERLRRNFLTGINRDVFSGILRMDIGEFQKNTPAYYISLIQRDVREIDTGYFNAVCGIYRVTVSFLITFALMVVMNPWLSVLNVIVALLSVTLPKIFERKLENASKEASDRAEEYQGVISDALSGFNTIKLFSITERIKRQVEDRNGKNQSAKYRSTKVNFVISWISVLCSQLGYVLTIAIGVYLVLEGKMTVGAIVAISQLIGGVLAPFEELPAYLTDLKSVRVIIKKVQALIDTQEHSSSQEELKLQNGDLEVSDLCFGYDGKTILKDVNLRFEENKKYVLIGESGCGKSTLAKVILGFYPRGEGRITLGGADTAQLSQSQLYTAINYMQQDVFLFDDTVYNNITLYQDYPREKVEQAVLKAGLSEYINGLEDGWNTRISGNGYNLSGGQKQRIGLARSLLSGAKIILFDEVTSSLDVVLEQKIEETIMSLKDVTVIMITHRMNRDTLARADRLIVLRDGAVCETGGFDELLARKGLFYSYYTIRNEK